MRPAIADEFEPPFIVLEPAAQSVPFVFNVPHAGAVYPSALLAESRLDAVALRRFSFARVGTLRVPARSASTAASTWASLALIRSHPCLSQGPRPQSRPSTRARSF